MVAGRPTIGLTPTERAVFVLHEAFGIGDDEIAAAVDNPAAVHQIAHRAAATSKPAARAARSPHYRPRRLSKPSSERSRPRDLQGMLDVLAPDVVAMSDGGGIKQATPRPVVGADKVARFIVGGLTRNEVPLTVEPTVVNGSPALALHVDGELDGVITMRVEDTRITGVYFVRNPQKLTHIQSATPLTLR